MSGAKKTLVGSLSVRYAKNPGLRALLKIIPGWGSVDGLMQSRANEIKRDRLREFFDELGSGNTSLSPELIDSEDFLHCFFKTTQAAVSTRRREKIKIFAQMLKGALRDDVFKNVEDYEELLDIIDSISYRQFAVLKSLRKYEIDYSGKHFENSVKRIEAYWGFFRDLACQDFALDPSAFDSFMTRLEASGLYARNIGGWGANPSVGTTTKSFEKLCRLIEREEQSNPSIQSGRAQARAADFRR